MKPKYLIPFTGYGFNRLLCEASSKPVLINFINTLLPSEKHVKEITTISRKEYSEVYNFFCTTNAGDKIIVALQKAKHNYFRDKPGYYASFPIAEQAMNNDWHYDTDTIFCIGILDFRFNDHSEAYKNEVLNETNLREWQGNVIDKQLTYIYIQLPNFTKNENEIKTRLDKWLYFIKNLADLQAIPHTFKNDDIFVKAFDNADLEKLDDAELSKYEYSLKIYRDWNNVIDYAKQEAIELAKNRERIKSIAEITKALKEYGLSIELIAKTTGLTEKEIEEL